MKLVLPKIIPPVSDKTSISVFGSSEYPTKNKHRLVVSSPSTTNLYFFDFVLMTLNLPSGRSGNISSDDEIKLSKPLTGRHETTSPALSKTRKAENGLSPYTRLEPIFTCFIFSLLFSFFQTATDCSFRMETLFFLS